MKLTLTTFLLASSLSFSAAFFVQQPGPYGRTSVVAYGSRAASKKESRTKWLESRGFSSESAATVVSATSSGIMKNDDGLEFFKLVNPDGASAEVYLYGGVVTSYKDADGTEFIAVRPDAKMDGSKPISGGLSHCWPQVSRWEGNHGRIARGH